jgi:lipopolysaccharide transport system permease protein
MYATPIVYPLSLVPDGYRSLVLVNPLTGIMEGFRSALFGRPWNVAALGLSAAVAVGALVIGLYQFRSAERTFADTI